MGHAAQTGQAILAEDVREVPYFLANPQLPDTRSELAIPLQKGEAILGVLDLQSEKVGGLTRNDLDLMQAIANQVAVVIDNARLFERMQQAVSEAEELNQMLTREAWSKIEQQAQTSGYTYTKSGTLPTDHDWLSGMEQAVQQKNLTQSVAEGNGKEGQAGQAGLAIPLILRGEVIGVIGLERPSQQAWSEDELAAVRTLSEQISLALDAARLARETERSAWRDQMISESAAQVWSSSEIEDVMRAAVAQLGDKLQASEVVVRLGTAEELTDT